MMTYRSLFDHLAQQATDWSTMEHTELPNEISTVQVLNPSQSVEELITDLLTAIESPDSARRTAKLIWRPQQILKGALHYKVIKSGMDNSIEAVRLSIEMLRSVYVAGPDVAAHDVEAYNARIGSAFPNLLDLPIRQNLDRTTCRSSHPEYSAASVRRIKEACGTNILMLCLANGGVPAGTDIYLRLLDAATEKAPDMYVARMSKDKLGDCEPKLCAPEVARLEQMLDGKDAIVVFDEDIHSGVTMELTTRYLRRTFPEARTFIASNYFNYSQRGLLREIPQEWEDFRRDVLCGPDPIASPVVSTPRMLVTCAHPAANPMPAVTTPQPGPQSLGQYLGQKCKQILDWIAEPNPMMQPPGTP